MKITCSPDAHAGDDVRLMLARFKAENTVFRLWAKDSSLFTQTNESSMMDWLDEPASMRDSLDRLNVITSFAKKFTDVVLLGMGGSSLSVRVFQEILAPHTKNHFFVLDTTHPDAIHRVLSSITLASTLFIVASKSGSTMEPDLLYHFFLAHLERITQDPFSHFLAITDPVSPLEQESVERGFLPGAFGKPGIGGRYSAFSPFGILPALLMNIDAQRLLDSAILMASACGPTIPVEKNPGAMLGAFLATAALHGREYLCMHTSPSLKPLGMWLEQLIAESLGKENQGLVPVRAIHENDFVKASHLYISLKNEAIKPHLPSYLQITLDDMYDIGGLMYAFEIAVALAASPMHINPFDQPDVEKSKVLTKELIAAPEKMPTYDASIKLRSIQESLAAFFQSFKASDYCAILSYLDENDESNRALARLQNLVQEKFALPTMLQTGPRYLHSTGQLFKGGINEGHFLMITGPYQTALISDRDGLSFAHIHQNQAYGDYLALRQSHRSAALVRLDDIEDLALISMLIENQRAKE